MRLGYCCGFDYDEAAWAKEVGFTTLEIFYGGQSIEEWKKYGEWFAKNDFYPMSIFHYADYGHPDQAKAEEAIKGAYTCLEICKMLGIEVMTLNGWGGHVGGKKEKLARFKEIFTPMAAKAADMGLKIAIENCPHGLHNAMWSPEMWEAGFNEVPNEALGLEYDPSHLVWMGVDYVDALKKFIGRTYAFHAKDTEVFEDVLAYTGIYGDGWWRYRIPGWGEVDWQKLFTILWENNYAGDITIEHEDPVFHGERNKEGLVRGLDFLKDLIGDISK